MKVNNDYPHLIKPDNISYKDCYIREYEFVHNDNMFKYF